MGVRRSSHGAPGLRGRGGVRVAAQLRVQHLLLAEEVVHGLGPDFVINY